MTSYLNPNPRPRFPQELLDLFAEAVAELPHLDPLRRGTLLACNLVSHSFNHIARRSLFKQIKIDDNDRKDIVSSLVALHELVSWREPRDHGRLQGFGGYVKEFSLYISDSISFRVDKLKKRLIDETLANLLKNLHGPDYGVENLVLVFENEGLSWNACTFNLRKALFDLFRSPRLRYLRICNLGSLPRSFLRGTHIKHLHLYECMPAGAPRISDALYNNHEEDASPYPQLEVLDTDRELPLTYFESPSLPMSESSITKLKAVTSAVLVLRDFDDSLKIISKSKETIERLDFRYYILEHPLMPLSTFDLSTVRKLHHLCLYHDGGVRMDGPESAVVDFALFFEHLSPPPSLNCIEMGILAEGDRYAPQMFFDTLHPETGSNWTRLDAALSQGCFKSSVKDVRLSVHFNRHMLDEDPEGRKIFSEESNRLLRNALPSFAGPNPRSNLEITIAFSYQPESWMPRILAEAIVYSN